jgi:hypothetical protein
MKAQITIKDIYPLVPGHTAFGALGAAIKMRLLRLLAEKPVDEKAVAQSMNASDKSDLYWQQITIGSSKL